LKPRLFAAGEAADLDQRLVLAEAEAAEPRPHLRLDGSRHQCRHVLERRRSGSRSSIWCCAKKPQRQLRMARHMAGERLEAADDELRQGRLAVAVGAEQRDAIVGVEPQVEPAQHRLARRVADLGMVERQDRRAQFLGSGKLKTTLGSSTSEAIGSMRASALIRLCAWRAFEAL